MAGKPEQGGKRIGIWIRVSKEDAERGESLEHHEARARHYAEARGWTVVEFYNLGFVSGRTVWNHPEAIRMRADVERGHISGLVFSKLARLARNKRELEDFANHFERHNADLISLGEAIDTSTPAGRLFFTMNAGMVQWEREEIAARVAASVPVRARLGKPLGGRAPFGYRWEKRQLVLEPSEAAIRRQVYEWFLENGGRLRTVVSKLNSAGYRTRKGEPFSVTTVRWLIEDPISKGVRRANYSTMSQDGIAWQIKPESEWVFHEVEAIVTEETWEQANAILRARKRGGKKPTRRASHLFSGLVYCADGSKMYVPSNTPKYVCRQCRAKIPTDDLERVFVEQLQGFFLSEDGVREHLAEAEEKTDEKAALLDGLRSEREKLDREMKKVYQLYIGDQLSAEAFGRLYRPLEERASQLDDEIPALQAEVDLVRMANLSSEDIAGRGRTLFERWNTLSFEERREVVEKITQRITVDGDEIALVLCYLPPGKEVATWSSNVAETAPPVFCAGSGSLANYASLPSPE